MNTDAAEHRAGGREAEVAQLGGDFVSKTTTANGTSIHYVRGGSGPALVLLHGFPQDWFEWRRLMPRLAHSFTVIAVDLRGVGGSAAPTDGYAAADLAEDVHQLLSALGIDRAHIVGHDIGGWVATRSRDCTRLHQHPADYGDSDLRHRALPARAPCMPLTRVGVSTHHASR